MAIYFKFYRGGSYRAKVIAEEVFCRGGYFYTEFQEYSWVVNQ